MFKICLVLFVIIVLVGFGMWLGKHNSKKVDAIEKAVKEVKKNV
jgi:hypothetical protein